MDRSVLHKNGDVTGNPILRVFRHQLLARCLPLGNYRGGAGFRCLVIFSLLHYLGRPLFGVLIRYERQLNALYRLRERLRQGKVEEDSTHREGV
ncbi:MAG: hypothetical protein RBR09_06155 [Desulfobulbaceae bacterium]|jgi:hypothetical protein|nr:hypothetical protein [Desulfobulbaceae bacterium]